MSRNEECISILALWNVDRFSMLEVRTSKTVRRSSLAATDKDDLYGILMLTFC